MDEPTKLTITDGLLLTLQRTLTLYTMLGYTPSLEELRYYLEHGYIPGNAPDWPQIKYHPDGVMSNVMVFGPDYALPTRVVFRRESMLVDKATSYPNHIYYIQED